MWRVLLDGRSKLVRVTPHRRKNLSLGDAGPGDKEETIEWDSEILADEPGHRIALAVQRR